MGCMLKFKILCQKKTQEICSEPKNINENAKLGFIFENEKAFFLKNHSFDLKLTL